MRERFRCIARVVKPHGKRGEVVTVPVHGLPAVLREGMDVCLVPPLLKADRWHTVESCSGDDRGGCLVALSGVGTIDAASELRGRYLLAHEADLPADFELHDADRLCGREVADAAAGPLGRIAEVLRGPANDVWVIRDGDRELLLPVIDSVVREVCPAGPIAVDASGFLGDWGEGS